jgi:DNA-binding transcriptional regulator LsrR (DeoR family)
VATYVDNIDICLEVARLFYESQLSQTQIAEQLHLSRPTVAAILKRARELGVVQIMIRDPRNTAAGIEQALEAAYPGVRVLVAAGRFHSEESSRQMVAAHGARFLRSILANDMTVGLGWGTMMHQLVETLDFQGDVRIRVAPMLGGSGQIAPHYQGNELVRRFADAFHGQPVFLHAPVLVDSPQVRDYLLSESSVRTVWENLAHLDVAITGVGTISTSAIDVLGVDRAWAELFPELIRGQIAGQMCLRCFDVEGRDAEHSLDNRLLAITLPDFRRARYRIGMAAGRAKVRALQAALCGRILNVLVTDEDTGLQILEQTNRVLARGIDA